MTLSETFAAVRPSIVALGSKMIVGTAGQMPVFPKILGTGFIVDPRGIVMTNRHVSCALRQLPPHPQTGAPSAFAILFDEVRAEAGA